MWKRSDCCFRSVFSGKETGGCIGGRTIILNLVPAVILTALGDGTYDGKRIAKVQCSDNAFVCGTAAADAEFITGYIVGGIDRPETKFGNLGGRCCLNSRLGIQLQNLDRTDGLPLSCFMRTIMDYNACI